VYRDNELGQNPAYRIRDDYRKQGNSWTGRKDLAHGEINENAFSSYVAIAQHRQKWDWLNSTWVGGMSADLSPNTSVANYIRINKDTASNRYTHYVNRPDSLLSNYKTGIFNFAAFMNVELSPARNLRIVISVRHDAYRFGFDNYLPASSVSGSPDTVSRFNKFSSKVGITYNFGKNRGVYANYSEGFVPPQVTELYRAAKMPSLRPSVFRNYEAGGWIELLKGRLTMDMSAYMLEGRNAIISVRFDDGTFGNANAGATLHKGIEIGIHALPAAGLSVKFSGSLNKHTFTDYVEKGINYTGKEMNSAPRWIHHAEVSYTPNWWKGFRLAAEWQKMSGYYMDQANSYRYPGFNVCNLRGGYTFRHAEIWLNVINVLNSYYAVNSTRSSFGSAYTPGEPRHFTAGISYDAGKFFTRLKQVTKKQN
jgi:outer membrane receptor protein involved in Fe transport